MPGWLASLRSSSAVATLALVVLVGALQLQQGSAEGALETGRGPEAEDALRPDDIPEGPLVEVRAGRHSRATCDLLSFQSKWVTPNHSACAAHCIAMLKGFKGGYCKNAVCHCRK